MDIGNSILLDDSLRLMRIEEHPIKSDENLLIVDQLERGFLQLYEYMGGGLYISTETDEMNQCNNVALVAELTVTIRPEKREVRLNRIFNEFGYDYVHLMTCQLIHFADFYGFSLALLDLSKPNRKCA